MAKRRRTAAAARKPRKAKASSRRFPKASPYLKKLSTAVRRHFAKAVDLPTFLSSAGQLTAEDRKLIVRQALILLDQNYAHLPLKKAMHSIDPVQRLRVLLQALEMTPPSRQLSEVEFHAEMTDIFTSVRDLHTNYLLPAPFNEMTAFLPFMVEDYVDHGKRRYLVSHVAEGFRHPTFRPGSRGRLLEWHTDRSRRREQRATIRRQQPRRATCARRADADDAGPDHHPAPRRGVGGRRLPDESRQARRRPARLAGQSAAARERRCADHERPGGSGPRPRPRAGHRSTGPQKPLRAAGRRRREKGRQKGDPRCPGGSGERHAQRVRGAQGDHAVRNVRVPARPDVLRLSAGELHQRVHPPDHRPAAARVDSRRQGQRRRRDQRRRVRASDLDASTHRAGTVPVHQHAAQSGHLPPQWQGLELDGSVGVGRIDAAGAPNRVGVLGGLSGLRSRDVQCDRPEVLWPGGPDHRRTLLQHHRHFCLGVSRPRHRAGAGCRRKHGGRWGERLGTAVLRQ